MARRRGVGGFNTASSLIQMYIQDQMARERATLENQLQGGRQREDDVRNFILQSAPRVASGELKPDALPPELVAQMKAYYDPAKLAPSIEQRVGGIVTPFLAKNAYTDIPDEQGIVEALRGAGVTDYEHPAVINALNAVKARKESLKPFIPATAVSQYDPITAASKTTYVPQNELGGMSVQTSPTPAQKGANTLTESLSGELSPQMTQAKIGATNAINRGTMGSEAAKAGALSNATAMGANADNVIGQRMKEFNQKEAVNQANALELKAAPSGATAQAKNQGGALTLEVMLQRVEDLNARIPDQNWAQRMKTGTESFLGINTDAADLDNAAESGGMLVAQALQPQGPYSDADAKAGSAFFPKSYQPKEYRDRVLSRLRDIVTLRPQLEQMFGPSMRVSDPNVRNVLRQMLDQRDAQRGLPPLPPDPNENATPAPPNVLIKEF